MPLPRKPRSEKRLEIERLLAKEDEIYRRTGRHLLGFRVALARKFSVNKQRITEIARQMGLTEPERVGKLPGHARRRPAVTVVGYGRRDTT